MYIYRYVYIYIYIYKMDVMAAASILRRSGYTVAAAASAVDVMAAASVLPPAGCGRIRSFCVGRDGCGFRPSACWLYGRRRSFCAGRDGCGLCPWACWLRSPPQLLCWTCDVMAVASVRRAVYGRRRRFCDVMAAASVFRRAGYGRRAGSCVGGDGCGFPRGRTTNTSRETREKDRELLRPL